MTASSSTSVNEGAARPSGGWGCPPEQAPLTITPDAPITADVAHQRRCAINPPPHPQSPTLHTIGRGTEAWLTSDARHPARPDVRSGPRRRRVPACQRGPKPRHRHVGGRKGAPAPSKRRAKHVDSGCMPSGLPRHRNDFEDSCAFRNSACIPLRALRRSNPQ